MSIILSTMPLAASDPLLVASLLALVTTMLTGLAIRALGSHAPR